MQAPRELDLASAWFLAARAMVASRGDDRLVNDGASGLYAQAILGLSEDVCLEAKRPEHLGVLTLVDCLSIVRALEGHVAEKLVTGVMVIAFSNETMCGLEVRWASMLTSAARLSSDDFQRCCASARVIAAMLRPRPGESPA